jgi:hypothetical protein
MPEAGTTASRKLEPGLSAARVDLGLQALADRLNRRRLYYDVREYLRARAERLDLAPNRALGALFVHIPKCGGTSVENQIGVFHGHRSAVYFRAADRELFARAFKFTLVRNPYDRLVSGFHYLKHHSTAPLDRAWAARALGGIGDFREFAEALEDRGFARRVVAWRHFVPQWYFVCDGRGAPMMDLVGRIEDFDGFVAELGRRSALRLRNEVHRASARRPWQDYYTPRARAAAAALYREDFRAFGYAE